MVGAIPWQWKLKQSKTSKTIYLPSSRTCAEEGPAKSHFARTYLWISCILTLALSSWCLTCLLSLYLFAVHAPEIVILYFKPKFQRKISHGLDLKSLLWQPKAPSYQRMLPFSLLPPTDIEPSLS